MTATDERVEAAARVILAELGYRANFPAMTAIVPVAAKALAAADAAALAQAEGLVKEVLDITTQWLPPSSPRRRPCWNACERG